MLADGQTNHIVPQCGNLCQVSTPLPVIYLYRDLQCPTFTGRQLHEMLMPRACLKYDLEQC